jgi:CRISPR-associated protein Csh2
MLLRVIYKEKSQYFIGLLDELVKIKNKDSKLIRQIDEVEFDFSKLIMSLNNVQDEIAEVQIVLDDSLKKFEEEFKKINNVKFIDEKKIME